MSKDEIEIRRKGGIDTISPNSAYQNYAQNFIEAKKFGKNDVVFYNLGVRTEDIKTVYGNGQIDKQQYEQLPKFYKDGEVLKEYNNGKEVKEECAKIVNILNTLQKNYGNNSYSPKVREDLNQRIGAEMTALNRLYNAEDYPENLAKARMTSAAKANRDMQNLLLNLHSDVTLPPELKSQLENSLNLIRENQNPNIPLEKMREATAGLTHPDKTPAEVEELDKKIRQSIDSVLKSAAAHNISNPDIKGLAAIQSEDANLRMTVSTDYSKVLNLTKQSVARFEEISQQISQLTPLAYGGATIQIAGSKPTKQDMAKAYTQLILEQQAITGIAPSDKDFHSKVKDLDPKTLGKIEVSFQTAPPENKVLQYNVSNEKFIKALKKIDNPEMLQFCSNVTFKTDSRDIPNYSVNNNTLLQQLKGQDPIKYGKLSVEDLKDVTIELQFRKQNNSTKPEKEKTPLEKAVEENLKVLNDSSTSKEAFKNDVGTRHENIESVKLTYTDKSGSKHEVPLTVSQFMDIKAKVYVKSAAEMTFFALSSKEKAMTMNDVQNLIGSKHPEKIMKPERVNSTKAAIAPLEPTLEAEPNLVQKTVLQPKIDQANIVFPAEATEVFHKTKPEQAASVRNSLVGITKLAGGKLEPAKATTTIQPIATSKAVEDLKEKLQKRMTLTPSDLSIRSRPKTSELTSSIPKTQAPQRKVEGPVTKAGMKPLPPVPTQTSRPELKNKPLPPIPTQGVQDPATKTGKKPLPLTPIQTSRPELKSKPLPSIPVQRVQDPVTKTGKKPLPLTPIQTSRPELKSKPLPSIPVQRVQDPVTKADMKPLPLTPTQTSRPELKNKPLPLTPLQKEQFLTA